MMDKWGDYDDRMEVGNSYSLDFQKCIIMEERNTTVVKEEIYKNKDRSVRGSGATATP